VGLAAGVDECIINDLMIVLAVDYVVIMSNVGVDGSALVGIECDHLRLDHATPHTYY
jgi:hypothetical protein